MTFKDILFHLDTYPDRSTEEAVEQGVELCAWLGRQVTAVAVHAQIPLKSNRLADLALNLSDLAKQEEHRSLKNAEDLLYQFELQAKAKGLSAARLITKALVYEASEHVAEIARTHDVCVIPYGGEGGPQPALAETVVFGSGRPVVIFKPASERRAKAKLDTIVIAWDGGRAASRAVADAIPLLTVAREVRILVALNEKSSVRSGAACNLARHLSAHGVAPLIDEIDVGNASIGTVIGEHAAVHQADLLVMGAFGHSRLREFVLGGATQSIVRDPPIPVLLSH